jgi:hypothetical protein
MRGLSRLFWYLVYFFQAETPALRKEALQAARVYYGKKPLRTNKNPYPRVIAYQQRLEDFRHFQRGYINQRCSDTASAKLAEKYPR